MRPVIKAVPANTFTMWRKSRYLETLFDYRKVMRFKVNIAGKEMRGSTTANIAFSAMLAEEYILIDISLSTATWCDFSSYRQLKFIQLPHFYLSLVTGLDVKRNISTA